MNAIISCARTGHFRTLQIAHLQRIQYTRGEPSSLIMFKLQDKTCIVTGAGSGIGAAIAQVFARAGAFVCVTDRDDAAGNHTVESIQREGGKAGYLTLDVTQVSQCESVVNQVEKNHSTLDILVNNAGIGHVGTIEKTSPEDLERLWAVNVKGVFNVTQAGISGMIRRQSGVIINIASIGGLIGIHDRLAYCTTKFAVVGLTKCLALDHAKQGIRVNCICPGRVHTAFVDARLKEYSDPQKAYAEMSATQPIGRMGRPEEIAHAALYLASDEAALITGAALAADGGWSAG